MKKMLTGLLAIALHAPAHAGSVNTGQITVFNLNSNAGNRGVCIQMEPSLPSDTNGWACLNDVNQHLGKEITSLLLTAYASKANCSIFWDTTSSQSPPGHAIITVAECK